MRAKAFDALDALPGDDPGFVFGMVISHECQHGETMMQALNLRCGAPLLDAGARLPPGGRAWRARPCVVPGGPFVLGVDAVDEPFSLDNERPAHVVDVPAFRIGRVPVTNAEWQTFIEDDGYNRRQLWSERGWRHRQAGRPGRARVLEPRGTRGHPNPVRPRRAGSRRRARPACHFLRGRGVRDLGGCPTSHGDRMGESLRLGSAHRIAAAFPLGRAASHGSACQPRRRCACVPPRWARTRSARRRTALNR